MYLAVCEDQKEELDAVCSLLDAWAAEHGAALRRKAFQSAAEMLETARREKLFALLDRLWLQEQKNSDALILKTSPAIVRVPFSQISYVEVIRKNVYFHLVDGTVREVTGTLKDIEAMLLHRPEFMRVHRSYIVNMFQVERLSPAGLRTFQGKTLPVSRALHKEAAGRWLDRHLEGGC